jgi:hypothetical protein
MYNGNAVLTGGAATTGGVLAATGADSIGLAVAAAVFILAGFTMARVAGRKQS